MEAADREMASWGQQLKKRKHTDIRSLDATVVAGWTNGHRSAPIRTTDVDCGDVLDIRKECADPAMSVDFQCAI
ncbi:hypothetical protein T12_7425 [Trichinella patagoniensis]|uniref:Uncharacterized protein n=1 Tax=Trichinella patagoniensis TaxID=990121 RepID=A0A0V0ZSM4_9BILA|nr:hypothetical protein T12_7425 [Trichinella patagoniensis]